MSLIVINIEGAARGDTSSEVLVQYSWSSTDDTNNAYNSGETVVAASSVAANMVEELVDLCVADSATYGVTIGTGDIIVVNSQLYTTTR